MERLDHARILIYSHDSFGLGHLRRCRAIAHAIVDRYKGVSVLILSGSPIIGSFDFLPRVDFVRIPGVVKLHNGEPSLQPLTALERMADEALSMLRQALDAFANRDAQLARDVCALDDRVDALYDEFYHEMLQRMISDPSLIMRATYLIWVSHNLERIADRATNICERVVYLVTGHMEELNVSTY